MGLEVFPSFHLACKIGFEFKGYRGTYGHSEQAERGETDSHSSGAQGDDPKGACRSVWYRGICA